MTWGLRGDSDRAARARRRVGDRTSGTGGCAGHGRHSAGGRTGDAGNGTPGVRYTVTSRSSHSITACAGQARDCRAHVLVTPDTALPEVLVRLVTVLPAALAPASGSAGTVRALAEDEAGCRWSGRRRMRGNVRGRAGDRRDVDREQHAASHGYSRRRAGGSGHRMRAPCPPVTGQARSEDRCVFGRAGRGGRGGGRGRGQDRTEPTIELGELAKQVLAGRAVPEVLLHGRPAALAQAATRAGAELGRIRTTRERDIRTDMLLQVGLPKPSRARMARAETPLADRPNIGATAAGALPSTSSCHRTSRQRAGS